MQLKTAASAALNIFERKFLSSETWNWKMSIILQFNLAFFFFNYEALFIFFPEIFSPPFSFSFDWESSEIGVDFQIELLKSFGWF